MSAQDCCNQNCRQGRDCPQRLVRDAAVSAHTPGPWTADIRHETCAYLIGPEISYSECYFTNANDARLIVVAPNMLDALRQWAHAEFMGDADELANARLSRDAAIAEATGTTS